MEVRRRKSACRRFVHGKGHAGEPPEHEGAVEPGVWRDGGNGVRAEDVPEDGHHGVVADVLPVGLNHALVHRSLDELGHAFGAHRLGNGTGVDGVHVRARPPACCCPCSVVCHVCHHGHGHTAFILHGDVVHGPDPCVGLCPGSDLGRPGFGILGARIGSLGPGPVLLGLGLGLGPGPGLGPGLALALALALALTLLPLGTTTTRPA